MSVVAIRKPVEYGVTSKSCPCCDRLVRSEVRKNAIGFDYDNDILFKGDDQIILAPREADALKILLDAWPELVTRRQMLTGLHGANFQDLLSSDVLGVCISDVRKKIRQFGLEIVNIKRRGWYLQKSTVDAKSRSTPKG